MKKQEANKIAGISDEAVKSKTGKTWAEWIKVLDKAKAYEMPHKDIAIYLSEKHQVPDWWSQMVTVGYEQARGLREKHERPEGYQISVSKTLGVPVATLYAAWTDEAVRALAEAQVACHSRRDAGEVDPYHVDGQEQRRSPLLLQGPGQEPGDRAAQQAGECGGGREEQGILGAGAGQAKARAGGVDVTASPRTAQSPYVQTVKLELGGVRRRAPWNDRGIHMSPAEYEQIVSQIAQSLYKRVEGIAPEVKYGKKNLWQGKSGHEHQIDVSARGPSDLILVECKRWTSSVPVEKVLAFFGRVNDIAPTFAGEIHAVIVTTKSFQPGAEKVAKCYNIDLQIVHSASKFVFEYKRVGLAASSQSAFMRGAPLRSQVDSKRMRPPKWYGRRGERSPRRRFRTGRDPLGSSGSSAHRSSSQTPCLRMHPSWQ